MTRFIDSVAVKLGCKNVTCRVSCSRLSETDLTFAFYLMKGKERIDTKWYSKSNSVCFDMEGMSGQFSILAFVKEGDSDPERKSSSKFFIDAASVEKRSIRLKEWPPLSTFCKTPSDEYLGKTKGLISQEYRVTTDENGFINPGCQSKNKDAEKWVFLGGSFVESLFVQEGGRFTDILQNKLHEESLDIQVLNGGYSGSTLLHTVNSVINKVLPLKPAKLVVFVETNDSRCLRQKEGYWTKDKQLSPILPCLGESERNSEIDTSTVPLLLNILSSAAMASKIELFIATVPFRYVNFDEDQLLTQRYTNRKYFDSIIKDRFAVSDVVRTWTESNDIELIDLEKEMLDFKKYSYDELHLNEFGSNQLANILLSRMA